MPIREPKTNEWKECRTIWIRITRIIIETDNIGLISRDCLITGSIGREFIEMLVRVIVEIDRPNKLVRE